MGDQAPEKAARIHIYRGTNVQYCARVRRAGHRRMHVVQEWTTSRRNAFRAVVDAMAANSEWRVGDVLMIADYYDPTVVLEVKR